MTTATIQPMTRPQTPVATRESRQLIARARSQCGGAIVRAGNFDWDAGMPPSGQESDGPDALVVGLGALAASAVTSIRDSLAPEFGVRVHGVQATVSCDAEAGAGRRDLSVDLEIESPDGREAIDRLARMWRDRSPALRALAGDEYVEVSARAVDWYGGR